MTIARDGSVIAGVRTKTFNVAGEPIDITNDDDSGYRTLLEASGQLQIDSSVEGVAKDDVLVTALANGGTLITSCTLTLASGATIVGNFRLNSIELGGAYNEAVTFTAELQSSGAWTFNAAA
jgi:predicted secreted protein